MTAVVASEVGAGWAPRRRVALTPRRELARAALVLSCVVATSLVLELLLVSNLQQRAAQQRAFDAFRADLAAGTAPVGPVDGEGRPLALGDPVAYVEIPAIGLRQVVGEGTTPAVLFDGPGHRRDTPLPGQVGTSMLLGRRAAFGGSFARLGELEAGDLVRVTTGQGEFEYRVLGVREDGDRAPAPPGRGEGRLILATAAGRAFLPSSVLRVDAELDGDPVSGPAPAVRPGSLPAGEQLMGSDTGTLWALALWLQALVAATVLAVWSWHRWGRPQTWVVFTPLLLLVGIGASGEAARLLPNLL